MDFVYVIIQIIKQQIFLKKFKKVAKKFKNPKMENIYGI